MTFTSMFKTIRQAVPVHMLHCSLTFYWVYVFPHVILFAFEIVSAKVQHQPLVFSSYHQLCSMTN